MSSFADELMKAGLINKKKAKQLKHEQRVDRKENKGSTFQEEQQKAEQERKEKERLQKEEERKRREQKEKQDRLRNLAQANKINTSGPIRHYFVTRDQKILYLEVHSEMNNQLIRGTHAIVEVFQTNEHVIVPRAIAQKMGEVDLETVRFLNGSSS